MDKERVLRNRTVIVKNGIISKISKSKKTPKDAIKIDGTGKYLTPDFIDHKPCDCGVS